MGDLMRQNWVPAMKSGALVSDGDPVRLTRAKGGNLPRSATDHNIHSQARGGQMMAPIGAGWLASYEEQIATSPLSAFDLAAAE